MTEIKPVSQPITRPRDFRPGGEAEGYHAAVWADTGNGKTFLMNQAHKDSDRPSILIAQPKDGDDYELYGAKPSSKADLKRKLENGRKIHFNPPTNPKDFMKELLALYEVAKQVSKTVEMYIDEAHRLVSVQRSDEISMTFDDFITDARGAGVRVMFASQSLNRFTNQTGRDILGNVGIHVFLGVNKMQKGFYDYYDFPYSDLEYLNQSRFKYCAVRFDGNDLSRPSRLKA